MQNHNKKYRINWTEVVDYEGEVEAQTTAQAYEKWLMMADKICDVKNVEEKSLKIIEIREDEE